MDEALRLLEMLFCLAPLVLLVALIPLGLMLVMIVKWWRKF